MGWPWTSQLSVVAMPAANIQGDDGNQGAGNGEDYAIGFVYFADAVHHRTGVSLGQFLTESRLLHNAHQFHVRRALHSLNCMGADIAAAHHSHFNFCHRVPSYVAGAPH